MSAFFAVLALSPTNVCMGDFVIRATFCLLPAKSDIVRVKHIRGSVARALRPARNGPVFATATVLLVSYFHWVRLCHDFWRNR